MRFRGALGLFGSAGLREPDFLAGVAPPGVPAALASEVVSPGTARVGAVIICGIGITGAIGALPMRSSNEGISMLGHTI